MDKFNNIKDSKLSEISGGAKWGFWRCAGLAFEISNWGADNAPESDKRAWKKHCS